MKKKIILAALVLAIPLATSVNLQTNAETPDRVLYPNETVDVNLSVENLDTRPAENTSILLEVGEREFEYDAGDIEPGEEFNRTLELPEFPAGSYQAKATVNYTGFLGERFTETTRSGFKVRFPDFVRIPRQVHIQDIKVPDNVTSGDEKTVNAVINHDGDIEGDFTAAVVSKDSRTEKEFELSPGSQRNLTVQPTFYSPGVSFAETRLYADINDDLFLLDYLSEQILVKERRVANVKVGSTSVVKNGNSATVCVSIRNKGPDTAYSLQTQLNGSSNISESDELDLLSKREEKDVQFSITNPSNENKHYNLTLKVSYKDGAGQHTKTTNLEVNISGKSENKNIKRESKYSEREFFITTDNNWQKVLSLTPVAVWNEEGKNRRNPVLVVQDGSTGMDADSAIDFIQDYNPSEVTVIGETPNSLDRLLVANKPLGAGLSSESISRVKGKSLYKFWKRKDTVIYTPADYSKALIASEYASLINAPLMIEDYNNQKLDLENKNTICVSAQKSFCDDSYSKTELQAEYIEKTGTEKVIVTNPDDLEKFKRGLLKPEKSAGVVSKLYRKTSLSAPFLAAAKEEVIIEVNGNSGKKIDQELESKLSQIGLHEPSYLTIMGSNKAIKDSKRSFTYEGHKIHRALDQTLYGDFNNDSLPDVAVGRIKGMTTTDVSSYIARAITYKRTSLDDKAIFMASPSYPKKSIVHETRNADAWSEKFKKSGWKSSAITPGKRTANFEPENWKNKDLISYADHGNERWSGIYSGEIPELDGSFVSSDACSTCASETTTSFCMRAIRKGAIGYTGAVSTAFVGNKMFRRNLNNIYRENMTIGEAFQKAFKEEASTYGTGPNKYTTQISLIGDPTINIREQNQINTQLRHNK